MGCSFCFSGRRKFERNLTFEEFKAQLDVAWQYLGIRNRFAGQTHKLRSAGAEKEKRDFVLADKISSIVFMGMGEPMANLGNVLEFCEFLNKEYGYAYSRILISTSGVVPGMEMVIEEYPNKIQLAVSLHSPFQDVRDKIMPGLKGFSLERLIKICHRYNEVYRQKIMIEYVMIEGVNDREEDLGALLGFGFARRTLFNLIALNGEFELDGEVKKGSSRERMEYFREKLIEAGYKCFTRMSMGEDIEAACGMIR